MNSSKFYRKSLTLLLPILQMIDSEVILSDIAKALDIHKSHISYYIRRAKDLGYVQESPRSAFKILELTQAGKNFLAMYTNSSSNESICRAENVRFKADIIKLPSDLTSWHKVDMNNWTQYCYEINESRCTSMM